MQKSTEKKANEGRKKTFVSHKYTLFRKKKFSFIHLSVEDSGTETFAVHFFLFR